MMSLTLEVEDGVDDVLECLRAGKASVFGDVADKKGRDVVTLGGEQELGGSLAHLTDAAGGGLKLEREHGLHRIHDQQPWSNATDFLEDAFDAGLGEQIERRIADAKPLAARLDMMLGFLA